MKKTLTSLVAAGMILTSAGCAGPSAYSRVFEKQQSYNSRTYSVNYDTAWDAVNRATLGLNFGPDKEEKDNGLIEASRKYEDGKRTTTITLKASLQKESDNSTKVYANAIERKEKLFTKSEMKLFLGLVPNPLGGGGTTATRSVEGEKTIEDKKFYDSFFEEVQKELTALEKARTPEATQ